MTAKTHGYITKEIELEQIYQFILKWFDPNAKINRYENKNGENNEMAVYFTYKGEERRLFAIVYKSTKFSKTGQKERQIFLDLGYWGSRVEIMKSIISNFSFECELVYIAVLFDLLINKIPNSIVFNFSHFMNELSPILFIVGGITINLIDLHP